MSNVRFDELEWSVLDRLHIKQAQRKQKDQTQQQQQERSRKN